MAILSVLIFPTADAAPSIERTLLDLLARQLLEVKDAAMVTWPQGKKASIEKLPGLTGPGELSGVFWGTLFGLIFSDQIFGAQGTDLFGEFYAKFAEYGIENDFITLTRSKVMEGTSALLILSSDVLHEGGIAALRGEKFELIATNVLDQQANALSADFGAE